MDEITKGRLGRWGGVVLIMGFVFLPPLIQNLSSPNLPLEKLSLYENPRSVPKIKFQNPAGENLSLDNFRGKFVLLNVWATWCPPCKKEMPSLDRLALRFSVKDLQILPLSIDVSGLPEVAYFYRTTSIHNLPIYVDPTMNAMRELGVVGIPTTLLIDPEGFEVGRLIGPTKWDDATMVEQLSVIIRGRAILQQGSDRGTDRP